MTAPTIYRLTLRSPDPHLSTKHFHRWAWIVTDGYVRLLATGYTYTRWGARHAQRRYAAACRKLRRAELDATVARLHDAGIDVAAEVDHLGRVCVRPLCACTDVEHRRVMAEFLEITGMVRWAGAVV